MRNNVEGNDRFTNSYFRTIRVENQIVEHEIICCTCSIALLCNNLVIGNCCARFLVQCEGNRITKAFSKEARGNEIALYYFVVNVGLYLFNLICSAAMVSKHVHTIHLIQVNHSEPVHKPSWLVVCVQAGNTQAGCCVTLIVSLTHVEQIAVGNIYLENDGVFQEVVFIIYSDNHHTLKISTHLAKASSYNLRLEGQSAFYGIVNTTRKVDSILTIESLNDIGAIFCAQQFHRTINLPAFCCIAFRVCSKGVALLKIQLVGFETCIVNTDTRGVLHALSVGEAFLGRLGGNFQLGNVLLSLRSEVDRTS